MAQPPRRGLSYFGVLRRLAPFDMSATIDRLFRYLEMLVVTTLVTVAARAILPPGMATVINLVLCLFAGLYLFIPVVLRLNGRAKDVQSRFMAGGLALILAITTVYYANLGTEVIASTVQIDRRAAMASYWRWSESMAVTGCVRAGVSYEDALRCQRRAIAHYRRTAPRP